MKTLMPGIIAGAILGGVMWMATGTVWFLPAAIVLGLAVLPLARREETRYRSRKKRDQNFRD